MHVLHIAHCAINKVHPNCNWSFVSERKGLLSIIDIFSYNDWSLVEMLKSSEHEKSWHYSNYKSPNFLDCSEVRTANPSISFYYKILRIGAPGFVFFQ